MNLEKASALQPPNTVRRFGVASFVALLLRACAPPTVVRLVVAVVIDAVKGVLWRWPSPHVGQKILVGVPPSIAHSDASASVVWIRFQARIEASAKHADPCLEFGRPVASLGFAVGRQNLANTIALVTAATESGGAIEPRRHQNAFRSAVASTKEMTTGARGSRWRDNGPASEALPRHNPQRQCFGGPSGTLATRAAAASRAEATRSQFTSARDALPAAIALTQPVSPWTWIANGTKNHETTEPLAGQVYALHSSIITGA